LINVYLDDLRDCPEGFVLAKTTEEALKLFANNKVNILSLDHDLGVDQDGKLLRSGYDFVKEFCSRGLFAKKIYIHTDNPVGREAMFQTLLASKKRGFISGDTEIYRYGCVPNKYSGTEKF
jgi:hypothetical protein